MEGLPYDFTEPDRSRRVIRSALDIIEAMGGFGNLMTVLTPSTVNFNYDRSSAILRLTFPESVQVHPSDGMNPRTTRNLDLVVQYEDFGAKTFIRVWDGTKLCSTTADLIAKVEELFGCSFANSTPRQAPRIPATVTLSPELKDLAQEFAAWVASRDRTFDVTVKVQRPRRPKP